MRDKAVTRQDVFQYLNSLRKHGMANMMKANKFIVERFNITEKQAREYISNWIKEEK
tara:strand:- start:8357 stop:8527 length:171 start_codon:yes stop_codon:yes gene_type:complete